MHQGRDIRNGGWFGEQEALHAVAAVCAQEDQLLLGFHPFRDHPHLKGVGHIDDGIYDGGRIGVLDHALDEALVDLDGFDRK